MKEDHHKSISACGDVCPPSKGPDRNWEGERPREPREWPWLRLGECTDKIGSGLTPLGGHATYRTAGIPLIRSQNVHLNRFDLDGLVRISSAQDEAMQQSRVLPNDVLLNITGASIGRVCVVPPEVCPANVNQHVCIIRLKNGLDPHFVSLFFSSSDFQQHIDSLQAGATRQALTKAMIEQFLIPSPPLATQRRIAAQLKEQLAEVDRARTALQAQLVAAKFLPGALLRTVFGDASRGDDHNPSEGERPRERLVATKLTKSPVDWDYVRLLEVCDLLPSRSIQSHGSATVTAITSACLTESGFDKKGLKTAQMASSHVAECTVGKGEILVARSNTPELVGRVAVFNGEVHGVVASDLTIRLLPHESIVGEFLAAYLVYLFVSGYWRERASGASGTMKKITRNQIQQLPVPVPSLPAQREIATQLRAEIAAATDLRTALEAKLATLDRLPAALLRQVFGEPKGGC